MDRETHFCYTTPVRAVNMCVLYPAIGAGKNQANECLPDADGIVESVALGLSHDRH